MTTHSPFWVDRLYAYSAELVVMYQRVDHELFRRFSLGLRRFKRGLGERATDPFWFDFLRALNRYWFWLSSAPIPFSDGRVRPTMDQERLDRFLSTVRLVYPAQAERAGVIIEDLSQLTACAHNPLLDRIESLAESESPAGAVVIRESRLLVPAREALWSRSATRGISVVGPNELRDVDTYERLILVGSAHWYPDHVFTAPRAPIMHVISYRWLRSQWRPRVWLIGADEQLRLSRDPESADDGELSDLDEEWPTIDWAAIERRAGVLLVEDQHQEEQDEVEARLVALHAGYAVFLEEQDGATCLAIDLREDETARVKRVPAAEVEPGMFVLLRTEGGGDYVIPVADRLLGDKAAAYRQAQREWKSRLRALIRANGIAQVARWLRELGAARADEMNVRHWASDRGIATRDQSTFAAIMRLLRSEHDTERYWTMMRTIRAAHLRAGMAIRRRLLHQVQAADLPRLRREGQLDFTLPEAEGGRLTALRVEAKAPNTTWVPSSRTGRVFERPD